MAHGRVDARVIGSSRPRSRRGAGEVLRAELLAAADRLQSEAGTTDAITIRKLVEVVGVSQAAVYLHFHSRDELIYDLALEKFNQHYRARGEHIASVQSPLERLTLHGIAYMDFALENRALFHPLLMGAGNENNPTRFDGLDLLEKTNLGAMIGDVREAMDQHLIAAGSPELVSCLLWMAVHGAVSLMIAVPGYPFPPRDYVVAAMLQFTSGALTVPLGNEFYRPSPGPVA